MRLSGREPPEGTAGQHDPGDPATTSNGSAGGAGAWLRGCLRKERGGGELDVATVRRGAPENKSESGGGTSNTAQMLAIAGVGVGVVAIMLTVLVAVAPIAAVTFVLGVICGVLLAPLVRRGAHWLEAYLR
jgi:hypothetical protein